MTKMSPITYVDASDPPMIVAHGDADCSVPPQQSQLLANRLALHGVEHEFILVPGAGHQKILWPKGLAFLNCVNLLMNIYEAASGHKRAIATKIR